MIDVRDKLFEILDKPIFPKENIDPLIAVVDYLIDNEVLPVQHSFWIVDDDGNPICANCACNGDSSQRYCGNCGAKMDLKE